MQANKLQSALMAAVQKLKGEGVIKVNDEIVNTLKMSKGTFSAYLNGSQAPSKNFVLKFKNAYGIDLENAKSIDAVNSTMSMLVEVKAMCRVILSVLAETEAARSGQLVGQVFGQLERAVKAEIEVGHQELNKG